MHLSDLKQKSIKDLAALAAEHDIDDAAAMRRQELIFALLQSQADRGGSIQAEGVLEILQDGFGSLRAPDHNYLPGADAIYVSPSHIRRFTLRTADTVSGIVPHPPEGQRHFPPLRVARVDARPPPPPRTTPRPAHTRWGALATSDAPPDTGRAAERKKWPGTAL